MLTDLEIIDHEPDQDQGDDEGAEANQDGGSERDVRTS
jgi:hypothetical protein